jgi:hypothetical protein
LEYFQRTRANVNQRRKVSLIYHNRQLGLTAWLPSSVHAWLNKETYQGRIQPLLASLTNKAVASALGSPIPTALAGNGGTGQSVGRLLN